MISYLQVLSKIDPTRYQSITIDKTQQITIVEPSNGEELYNQGLRTDVGQLSKHIIDNISAHSHLDTDQRFDVLTIIKVLSRILKNKEIQKSCDSEKHLKRLKNMKAALKKSLANTAPALTASTLEKTIPCTEKMTDKDKVIHNFYLKRSSSHQQIKEAYKEMEAGSRNLHPATQAAETFTYYDPITQSNCTFQAHRLLPSQKFMIHATNFTNAPVIAKQFLDQKFPQPHLCTSLINPHASFFGIKWLNRVALILAVDPRQIILTSSGDIGSPVNGKVASDGRSLIHYFYNTHEKLILITDRINQIHDSSGLADAYHRYRTQALDLRTVYSSETNKLLVPLHALSMLNNAAQFLESVDLQYDNTLHPALSLKTSHLERHHAQLQLVQLFKYYQSHPEKNHSPQEFMKIFHYPGSDIVRELHEYNGLLQKLHVHDDLKIRLQKMKGPKELLAITNTLHGLHNEVNVKLDVPGTRPTKVTGLVFSRSTLTEYADASKRPAEAAEFARLIQFAKAHHFPIYILENNSGHKAKL